MQRKKRTTVVLWRLVLNFTTVMSRPGRRWMTQTCTLTYTSQPYCAAPLHPLLLCSIPFRPPTLPPPTLHPSRTLRKLSRDPHCRLRILFKPSIFSLTELSDVPAAESEQRACLWKWQDGVLFV
ncbi:hypothetical protein E2C01_091301 [Portunus trituberculatus]|uniref:Secreted protein n=1 Tax=Portunus trituberculatus TaxID=210409 RepID=A0A5B7JUN3_PORTR|nr:hypothetical protein [Portunus trituberculatus]